MEDIPPGFVEKAREFLEIMPTRLDQYEALLDRNEIWMHRLKGTGILSQERALELGVTGPLLRATGHPWDLRKAMPYSGYERFDFDVPVGTVGDNYDRFKVRMNEMRESVKIVEQARRPARAPTSRRTARWPSRRDTSWPRPWRL